MKYTVEQRVPKIRELYFTEDINANSVIRICDIKMTHATFPVILATIPAQDFNETCKELEIKIIHLKQEIQEARSEMLEGVYNSNTNKIIEFESAISILRTLSLSTNKNDNEGEE